MELVIYIDGGSQGNPGRAGAGAILYNSRGELLSQSGQYIGTATNNVAEYTGLILALRQARQLHGRQLRIYSDSELMVKQYKGEYKVKSENLKPLYLEVKRLARQFESVDLIHIPREKNRQADAYVNKIIREGAKKKPYQKQERQP